MEKIVHEAVANNGPAIFNKIVWDADGQMTLGLLVPSTKGTHFEQLTVDISLDDNLKVGQERIELGINGTVYNRDKGYKVQKTALEPLQMPVHDENAPSKLQLFISNYVLETLVTAAFEKYNFEYEMLGADYQDLGPAALDTNTLEGIFPFLVSKFGKKIPADCVFGVRKVWGVETFEANKTDINN